MKVKIKDYEYEILEVDDVNDLDIFDKNGEVNNFATHDNLALKIKVYKNITIPHKRHELKHELYHAFINVYLSSFGIRDKFCEEDICEVGATFSDDIINIVNDYFKQN